MRVIARSFLAFGRTPEQVKTMLQDKNPDMRVWLDTSTPADMSLNVDKDSEQFKLARIYE